MTTSERRRRDTVNAMLGGNVAHAKRVATCVRAAIEDGTREREQGESMLRSIDAKVARWRSEMCR